MLDRAIEKLLFRLNSAALRDVSQHRNVMRYSIGAIPERRPADVHPGRTILSAELDLEPHRLPRANFEKVGFVERAILRLNLEKRVRRIQKLFARVAAQPFDGLVRIDDANRDVHISRESHDRDAVVGLLDREFKQIYERHVAGITGRL